jgi:hypothetical protein
LLSQPVPPPCCRHRASAKPSGRAHALLMRGEASAEPSARVRCLCPRSTAEVTASSWTFMRGVGRAATVPPRS